MGPVRWGGVGLSQTRPIPRSPDGDNNNNTVKVCYLVRAREPEKEISANNADLEGGIINTAVKEQK